MTSLDPVPAPARSAPDRSAPDRFRVALPAPLDVPASLAFLSKWGDDLLDRWDGTHLVRTVNSGGRAIPFVGVSRGTVAEPVLDVTIEHAADRPSVEAAVRRMFVFPPPEFGELLARDPLLAALDTRHPGLREVRQLDLFAALVRAISAQQVNLRWATTTRRRLAEAFGERHVVDDQEVYSLAPARLAEVEVAAIRTLQFTTRKAEYIRQAAAASASGQLDLATLDALPDEEVIARLTALRGIGRWTAEWVLARTLGRPRVVAGDLGVRKVVGAAYLRATDLPSEDAVRRATAHWGSSATVAQALLLRTYGEPVEALASAEAYGPAST
jgi:DNA-3-methyladenine glycosylase II